MKKSLFLVSLTLLFTAGLAAQQFYTVDNPNKVISEGKPRNAKTLEADKAAALKSLAAIQTFLKANGPEKTIAEINKGRNGAFASSYPASHFYLSVCRKKGEKGWPIVAHATNPALVGFDVPDVSVFQDNTGWQYLVDLFAKRGQSSTSVVNGLLWADPEWANGKKCRMIAYNQFAKSGADEYWMYFAVWMDE